MRQDILEPLLLQIHISAKPFRFRNVRIKAAQKFVLIPIKEFMNRNIVRRLTVLLIPAVCGIFILSFLAVSHMYSRDLIESIEAQTQYSVETASIRHLQGTAPMSVFP